MPPLLLDVDETAHALRTTPAVIEALADSGRLPAVHLIQGEAPKFRPEDLVGLVDDCASGGVDEGPAALSGLELSDEAIRPLRWELDADQVEALGELDALLEAHLPADGSATAMAAAVAGMDGATQERVIELWAKLPTFPDLPQEFRYRGPARWRRLPTRTA